MKGDEMQPSTVEHIESDDYQQARMLLRIAKAIVRFADQHAILGDELYVDAHRMVATASLYNKLAEAMDIQSWLKSSPKDFVIWEGENAGDYTFSRAIWLAFHILSNKKLHEYRDWHSHIPSGRMNVITQIAFKIYHDEVAAKGGE
jgi:hypothetical protein